MTEHSGKSPPIDDKVSQNRDTGAGRSLEPCVESLFHAAFPQVACRRRQSA
jgi:hypothetical protein